MGLVLFFFSAILAGAGCVQIRESATLRVAGSKLQLGLKICVKTLA